MRVSFLIVLFSFFIPSAFARGHGHSYSHIHSFYRTHSHAISSYHVRALRPGYRMTRYHHSTEMGISSHRIPSEWRVKNIYKHIRIRHMRISPALKVKLVKHYTISIEH